MAISATVRYSEFSDSKIFKFLNQCFARLQCWKKCLKFTKPTCWINSCFTGDTKTEVVQNTDSSTISYKRLERCFHNSYSQCTPVRLQ